MRKIIGILLLIVCAASIIFLAPLFYNYVILELENSAIMKQTILGGTLCILSILYILIINYYIIITLTGKLPVNPNSYKKIAYENELIKHQIEQRKLQKELKELQDRI